MAKRRITVAKLNEYGDTLQELQQQTQELIDKLQDHVNQHEAWEAERAERHEETETYVNEKREEIDRHATSAHARLNNIHTVDSSARESLKEILVASKAAEDKYTESTAMREAIAEDKDTLNVLTEKAKELAERVEELLPGAASAGLARAFKERKEVFLWPKRIWAWALALTLAVMFAAVFFDPTRPEISQDTFGEIFMYLFSRIPFAVPLVWMAWYAARRHSQALRLEEDYAHKESLSRSFEGYKKQISELEDAEVNKKQTLNLVEKTLGALSADPGRIYRERNEDGTPFSAIFRRRNGEVEGNESRD